MTGTFEYLRRLHAYIEHGVIEQLRDRDIDAAAREPEGLASICIKMGYLARFRNERKGGPRGPLTHRATAYGRAEEVAFQICQAMRQHFPMTDSGFTRFPPEIGQ